ncbi:hypothetical protein Nepgr_009292 [Nepenthes gracilis]|uniref:Uncharacterized protein n=1 Tax=Nepenthes gracilis TaxID=150966 RepID=A0AAD3XK10_NEPGR|nr:hypothetical protein Nepgr_009292 [Nepenthes gracilis]
MSREVICQFKVSNEKLRLTFRLMRVRGCHWASTSSVSIEAVILGNVLVAILSITCFKINSHSLRSSIYGNAEVRLIASILDIIRGPTQEMGSHEASQGSILRAIGQNTSGLGEPPIIWPNVEDVDALTEGYAAGNAIPSPLNNVEKELLKKHWAKWKATTPADAAMPHIKTYTRYNGLGISPMIRSYGTGKY